MTLYYNKNVELIIKTNVKSDKINIIGGLPDNIKFIDNHFNVKDLSMLLWNCDCFVFPSKAEGYGLPPREAMATSIPTIIVDFSALSDISDDNISFPIRTKERSPAIFDKNIADMHNFGKNIFGKWANPSQEELMEKMLFIYNNYDKAIDVGKRGADFIHKNEDINLCGFNLNKILLDIR
jgi:glycosyltransferase involved in cell wall biosynthesis